MKHSAELTCVWIRTPLDGNRGASVSSDGYYVTWCEGSPPSWEPPCDCVPPQAFTRYLLEGGDTLTQCLNCSAVWRDRAF